MEFENIIVDPIHIFNNEDYIFKKVVNQRQIHIVQEKNTQKFL